jgi:signal transduction histidine kinase/CheY-like chemotaxis protein
MTAIRAPAGAAEWATAAAVAGGCVLGSSVEVVFPGVGAAVWFPPYAILTAALWRSRVSVWWLLLLASSAGNFLPHWRGGASVSFVLLAEAANYLRAIVAAAGLRALAGRNGNFDSVREMVSYLLFVVCLAPGLAALAGAGVVVWHHREHPFGLVWREWALSNAITALMFLPLLTLDVRAKWTRASIPRRRAFELALLFAGLFAAGAGVFMTTYDGRNLYPARLYWPLPFLLWTAVRFGPKWTSAALLAVCALSTWGALARRGPFVFQAPVDNLLALQLFLVALSVPVLLLSSLLRQQQNTALALARAEEEQHRLEAQRSVEAALREADRRKDEFIATLGHELRNPLGSIAVSVELLRRSAPPGDPSAAARDSIARQLQHVTRLVNDLLDISRITHGTIRLQLGPVDLREVVRRGLEATRAIIDASGHTVALHVPEAPVSVSGDLVRLTQIATNLLTNAAKYTPKGGRIEVTVGGGPLGASLSVRDNGVGIAPEQLDTIFAPFTQLATSPDEGGLGIGLALVRQLVELHGGRVEAASDGVGQGAALTVHLPRLEPEPVVAVVSPAPVLAVPLEERGLAGRRVLIADDHRDHAEALRQFLARDHDVEVVHDGAKAVEAALRGHHDVLLLDLGLPLIDGIEVARRVRARTGDRRPLIVAVTGRGRAADIAQSTEAGFDHHLVKPIDLDSLARLLDSPARLLDG